MASASVEERIVFKYLYNEKDENDMDYATLSEKSLDEIMSHIRDIKQPTETKSVETGVNDFNTFDKLIADAAVGTQIGSNYSPMYKQKGIKRKLARIIERVYLRISQLITRDIRSFNATVISLFSSFRSNQLNLENRISQLETLTESIKTIEYFGELFTQKLAGANEGFNNNLQSAEVRLNERINQLETAFNQAMLNEWEKRLTEQMSERTAALVDKLNENSLRLNHLDERVVALKAILGWTNNAKITPESTVKIDCTVTNDLVFYHDFEEKFRGTQDDIRERLEVYVPILKKHFSKLEDLSVLDIGCGRGEWMDVLKNHGVGNAVGVDINDIQLGICNEKGHLVVKEDCLQYVCSCPNDSLDMITGFQIIEHLPINTLCAFLNECKRVLKPNGVILLETPNPNNLITAATYFYVDPTHTHPIHKDFAKFLVEHSGYSPVAIIEANPARYSKTLLNPICFDGNQNLWDENIGILNTLFFGPQDYAVLGVKA